MRQKCSAAGIWCYWLHMLTDGVMELQQLEAAVPQAGSAEGSLLLSFSLGRCRREEPAWPGLSAPQVQAELLSADCEVTWAQSAQPHLGFCAWETPEGLHIVQTWFHSSIPSTKDLAFLTMCWGTPLLLCNPRESFPVESFHWAMSLWLFLLPTGHTAGKAGEGGHWVVLWVEWTLTLLWEVLVHMKCSSAHLPCPSLVSVSCLLCSFPFHSI